MPRLAEGDLAPDFSLPDQDGKLVSLASLRKSASKTGSVIVYFYPADDTPGCTKEACQFNDNLPAFTEGGSLVVGISPDGAEKHQRFRAKYGLDFKLLSDADRSVMESYGAYGEKTLYGKKTVGVIRSTFLIGKDGKIKRAWYSVKADGHAAKVLEQAAG
jgi:peroxiredoxin Q/BCP